MHGCTTFTHLAVDEHVGYFHLSVIMNSAAIAIHVQVFVCIPVFNSLGYIAKKRIPGSCGIDV